MKSKKCYNKWAWVTAIGPTIIQHNKFEGKCNFAMKSIAKICKLEIADATYIITDGEQALVSASSETFSNSNLFQSMKHLGGNFKDAFFKK